MIEKYQTAAGHTVIADREEWITTLPSTMCFFLNRVRFEQKEAKQEVELFKNNAKFNFEKVLYAD